jgi:hypothetical protein
VKRLVLWIFSVSILFGATPEQVERYLLLSGSEDQLVVFEQMIDDMGQMLAAQSGQDIPLMQDSQMISIRFREHIQRALSESEMDEVIANYKHDVLRKLVNAEVLMAEPETMEAYQAFQARIQNDPLPAGRIQTVKSIVEKLYDEELLIDFFNKMFLPLIQKMPTKNGKPISKKRLVQFGKSFAKKMRKNNEEAMLFLTQDFSDEELEELDTLSGNSATSHETRAVFGAIVASMREAMDNMGERFAAMIRQHKHPALREKEEKDATNKGHR